MKHELLVILFASLMGCVSDSGVDRFEPDQVTTGIYQLHITTLVDTCDPLRFTGDATVGLFRTPDSIEIFDVGPDSSTVQSTSLPRVDGYAVQYPGPGKSVDPCAPSGDSYASTYAITGATSDEVEVISEENWTIAGVCPVYPIDFPSASCGATRRLHYSLLTACAPPCTVVGTPNLTCSCK